FQISGSTESLSTVETLQLVEEEAGRIRDSEVSDEELRVSKDAVQNSFVFHFDTRAKTLGRLMSYEYYGYPKDFLFQYQKGIAAVTKADVLRVARERLNPKDFVIVAVGNPKDFGKPLSTLGRPVSDIDLSIPEPKKEVAKADAASLARGKQLLAKVQDAVGGAAKLAAIKDTMQVAEVQLDASMGGTKIKQVNRWAQPGIFRQEVELPFGKVTSFSDGKTGWMAVPNQGDRPLPAAQLKQVQGEIFRNYFTLLLSDRNPDRTVNYAGAGVLEISDKDGNSTRLTVDEATGMPQKETYAGPQGPLEETWSNFKEVGGVKAPHQISVTTGGRKFADAVILELSVNTGATAEQLSKRP
ncbi:MAG: M16 family metallopeptidase, partial [Bryobacteraceae bacterium]